jgi:DNA-directed RNA polymerase specialized sigma24 family protein
LTKDYHPDLVCHQEIDGRGLLARANSGSVNLSTPGSIPVSVEAKHTAIQKQHNVFSALQALHPTRRDLVIAAYIHGESREQLSKRTGIPVNTIKTWIRRSLLEIESILRGKDKDREQVFSRAPQIDRKNQFELGATMG